MTPRPGSDQISIIICNKQWVTVLKIAHALFTFLYFAWKSNLVWENDLHILEKFWNREEQSCSQSQLEMPMNFIPVWTISLKRGSTAHCDWKVAGLIPGRSGRRILFSSVNFLCWLLFQYLFHTHISTVAHKGSWSFCQKCRWQDTASMNTPPQLKLMLV